MKIQKFIIFFCFIFISLTSKAEAPDFNELFIGKSACFFLFDLNNQVMVSEYNPDRCHERIPADSTFKIPLSLMAFDQHLITQKSIFYWDKKDKGLPAWNQNQTPQSWLKNSTVWVSQKLTPKLGLAKIRAYLKIFSYGNQDFSGDAGKNNGLTHAWLNSSLKISGDEQLDFLAGLVTYRFPISSAAMKNTIANMYLETLPHDWKLFGKTGTGGKDGWFVGFIQKDNKTYLFVLNFTELQQTDSTEAAGIRAKNLTKNILNSLDLKNF